MAKKKLKFKKPRRAFDRETFFSKNWQKGVEFKQFCIARVIPDKTKRQAYIKALIKGLEEEPHLEPEISIK